MLNIEELNNFKNLYLKKKKLERELAKVKKDIEGIEQSLINHMADNQVSKFTTEGGETIYHHKQIWPAYVDKNDPDNRQKLIWAMKQNALGYLIHENFNQNSFAAYLREIGKEDGEKPDADVINGKLPEAIAKIVKAEEKIQLRVRTS